MMKKHRFIAALSAVMAVTSFFGQEAFTSSFDSFSKDFPGFTAGGSVHLPKMVGGADAGMMTDRMAALSRTIQGATDELIRMMEHYRTGAHPYTKTRAFLALDARTDQERTTAAVLDLLDATDNEYVAVPISLHVRKDTPPAIAVKTASDYVLSQFFRPKATSTPAMAGAPLEAGALDDALMMLVWTFRPDYDRFTEYDSFSALQGPGYLIRLHANLSAVLEASFLERTVKAAASTAAPGEPVPWITARILQAFPRGRAVDMDLLKDLAGLTPDIQTAYIRLIVTLLPAGSWPELGKTIIPWAKAHLGSETDLMGWLEELARI
jgi:hypothetical protein